jgi:hypothetical protein
MVYLHRELTGAPKGKEIDHKNGDGLDNQKENLRLTTRKGNSQAFQNKRAGATSQFRGVHFSRGERKWVAKARADYKRIHFGSFDSEIEAARAYDSGVTALGFSKEALNFPNEYGTNSV